MSLVSEAIGFSILGMLIIVNRHQTELNGFSGGCSIGMPRPNFVSFGVRTSNTFDVELRFRHVGGNEYGVLVDCNPKVLTVLTSQRDQPINHRFNDYPIHDAEARD